jgi:hypothetical protein
MREKRKWSHDTLALYLREHTDGKPSRALLVSWEKRAVPSPKYQPALVRLGVPENLWPKRPQRIPNADELLALTREGLENQKTLHRDLKALAGTVSEIAALSQDILARLGEPPESGQARRAPRR